MECVADEDIRYHLHGVDGGLVLTDPVSNQDRTTAFLSLVPASAAIFPGSTLSAPSTLGRRVRAATDFSGEEDATLRMFCTNRHSPTEPPR